MLLLLLVTGCDGSASKLRPIPNQVVEKLDDTIQISLSAKVDILVVMDGSGSMSSHQANLKANIGAFVQELTKASFLDYRIAVTIAGCSRQRTHSQYSGDCSEGIFHRYDSSEKEPFFIQRGDVDEELLLKARLEVGTGNDARETFFAPIVKAITAPISHQPSNKGFLRSNAYLIPIFVTDTDDQSDSFTPRQFFDTLLRIKGASDLIIPYAALIPSSLSATTRCPRDSVRGSKGEPVRIEEFLRLAGGTYFNICGTSFGADLVNVAQDLVSRVEPVIYLEDRPYVPSIKLSYGGTEVPNDFENGWVYDPKRNVIRIGNWLDLKGKKNLTFQISYVKANRF